MRQFYVFVLFFFFIGSSLVNAQSHYIIEMDRITSITRYKLKTFDKGRPVEREIQKPSVKIGDMVTLRMTNFNELLYGLDVERNLQRKPESLVSDILRNSDNFLNPLSMSPAMGQLTNLLKNPPTLSGSRGDEGQYSLSNINRRVVGYLTKATTLQTDIKSGYLDEGLTKDEIEKRLDDAEKKFNLTMLKDEYTGIDEDLGKVMDSADADWMKVSRSLHSFDIEEIDRLDTRLAAMHGALRETDFIAEQTFLVDNNSTDDGNEVFEKFLVKANVYKRAVPLSTPEEARDAVIPYNPAFVKAKGDQLHQSISADLSVKNRYKAYFGVGVSRIFVPQSRSYFGVNYNQPGDSLLFKSTSAGGGKTAVGLSLCFDIPVKSSRFTLTGTMGYALAFWRDNSLNAGTETQKKGFVTTGLSLGLKKFHYLNLNLGCAWSEYNRLASGYRSDKYYFNDFSQAEINNAIRKTIAPAFYAGVSINL